LEKADDAKCKQVYKCFGAPRRDPFKDRDIYKKKPFKIALICIAVSTKADED